jgi:hypothetical protein
MHAREMHAREMHAREMHAREVHAMRHMPVRYTPMRHPPIRCTLVGYMPVRYVLIFENSFVVLEIFVLALASLLPTVRLSGRPLGYMLRGPRQGRDRLFHASSILVCCGPRITTGKWSLISESLVSNPLFLVTPEVDILSVSVQASQKTASLRRLIPRAFFWRAPEEVPPSVAPRSTVSTKSRYWHT